jgi:hypothetical protein
VLLEIEGHLLIAHAPEHRPDEEVPDQREHRERQRDAQREDGARRKSPGLEAECRDNERGDRQRRHQHGAPQRQLHPPATTDLMDDPDEIGVRRRFVASERKAHMTSQLFASSFPLPASSSAWGN